MIRNILKKILTNNIKKLFFEEYEKKLILNGKKLSLLNNRYKKKISDFSEIEFKVFSQWGEDGIIDWIISKLKHIPKIFLEIGTEDYTESNTRYLLQNRNWSGYLIEGDETSVKKIKKSRIFWKHDIKAINAFLNTSNINKVLKKLKVPRKIGLLSLDIDSIDYWILKKMTTLKPVIIVCEFNPLFGTKHEITVKYKENFKRNEEHYSNLFYGASIQAFIKLLKVRNYLFLGTNSAGNNAFFVQKNYSKNIFKDLKKKKIFNYKFRESRNNKDQLNFLNKKDSLKEIANKVVLDIRSNKEIKIKNIIK